MATHARCPSEILDAIPWYPSGLSEAERGAVEAHAADCIQCRSELGFVLGAELPREEVPDPDRVFARVLERIEHGPPRPPSRRAVLIARAVSFGAAALFGCVLGVATVELAPEGWKPRLFSVSDPPTNPSGLNVVFRAEASAAEIERELRSLGAHIVSGPDANGAYRLLLSPGADPSTVSRQLRNGGRGVARSVHPEDR